MEVYKFVRKAPFSRVFAALLLGALLVNYFKIPVEFLFGFVLFCYLLIFRLKKSFARGLFVSLAWVSVGLFDTQLHKLKPFLQYSEQQENILVSIDEQVKIKNKKYLLTTKLLSINDSTVEKANWRLLVSVPKDSLKEDFHYGQVLFLRAAIRPIKNYGNPYEFDYRKYLLQKRIVAKAWVPKEQILFLNGFRGNRVKWLSLKVRNYLLSKYTDFGIKGQNLAILSALSLGYKDGLERETKNIFAHTGVMHILAVSGLHVGIIFTILLALLRYIPANIRLKIQLPILLVGVWVFALISGLSASVTRAALMFSFVALAESLRRNTSIYNSVFLAATIQFLVNPLVIYEVGFQLSYLAVLSIIWLQPKIAGAFKLKKKLLKLVWELIAVSIAALIGTLPISLYYFHQFPNYFIFSNIVVVPLVGSMIMPLSLIFLSFSWFPILAKVLAFLLNLCISFLFFFVKTIEGLSFSLIQNIAFDKWEIFFSSAIILILILFFIKKHYKYLKYFLVLSVVFLSVLLIFRFRAFHQKTFIVYDTPRTSTYQFISGGRALNYCKADSNHQVYLNEMLQKTEMKMFCTSEMEYDFAKRPFFRFDKYFIAVLDKSMWNKLTSDKAINLDILVLSGKIRLNFSELNRLFRFKQIVIDASVNKYQRKKWIDEAQRKGIPFFDVRNQGAFVLKE